MYTLERTFKSNGLQPLLKFLFISNQTFTAFLPTGKATTGTTPIHSQKPLSPGLINRKQNPSKDANLPLPYGKQSWPHVSEMINLIIGYGIKIFMSSHVLTQVPGNFVPYKKSNSFIHRAPNKEAFPEAG